MQPPTQPLSTVPPVPGASLAEEEHRATPPTPEPTRPASTAPEANGADDPVAEQIRRQMAATVAFARPPRPDRIAAAATDPFSESAVAQAVAASAPTSDQPTAPPPAPTPQAPTPPAPPAPAPPAHDLPAHDVPTPELAVPEALPTPGDDLAANGYVRDEAGRTVPPSLAATEPLTEVPPPNAPGTAAPPGGAGPSEQAPVNGAVRTRIAVFEGARDGALIAPPRNGRDERVLSPSRDELVAPLPVRRDAPGRHEGAEPAGDLTLNGRPHVETDEPARAMQEKRKPRQKQKPRPAARDTSGASRRTVVVAAAAAALGVPVMVCAAVVVLPNTIGAVLPEALDDLGVTDPRLLASAFGASLPAAATAVPVAAAASRRFSPALVLMAGFVLLAAGQLLGGLVGGLATEAAGALTPGESGGTTGSTGGRPGLLGELIGGTGGEAIGLIFAVRILLGLGAGTILAGLLLYAARLPGRAGRLLGGWYAGVLVAALLAGIALAAPSDWRMLLQPYPMLTGPALALCGVLLWFQNGLPPAGRPPARAERALGTLPLLPALGLTVLAYASTLGWSPIARLTAAVLAVAAVLLLGYAGAADRSAARLAAASAAAMTGILAFPTVTVVAGTLLGYGPYTLVWGVLIAAAGTALGAGAVAGALPGRTTAFAGYVLVIAGMALLYAGLSPTTPLPPGPLPIAAGTVLLAAGLGTALGTGLAGTRGPAAAYALALLLPGALAGLMLAAALNATAPAPARLWPVVAAAVALAAAPGLLAGPARGTR